LKNRNLIVSVLLVLLLAFSASATILNLTNLPATTYAGYYVGTVGGNIDGSPNPDPAWFVCNDFFSRTPVPSTLEDVWLSDVIIGTGLVWAKFVDQPPGSRYPTDEDYDKYQRAAILMGWMLDNPASIGPIQFAIWNLFAPATPDPGDTSLWISMVMAEDRSLYDYSKVLVLTDYAPGNRNQEFMAGRATLIETGEVPEPATMAMLATGILAIFFIRRRQRRALE